ncbi:acyl-CoA synthetase [Tumebacillus permanentifrigoris]|uniref:Acetyl-CoA synthetase n=1 Tax=Tumebacillus permanentifrigoris TaxID=378543 RepID=A0A316DAH4_9BACL|nr:acyl--CoA ligase [Tumebacillus permanentifrigoris]PWK14269.1 acetyl-CoA synthetase [Tumebacillus permanentifrigoris]
MSEITLNLPTHYNFAAQVDQYAAEHPKQLAVHWENEAGDVHTLTYGELRALSAQWANALTKLGVTHGDKVIVLVPRLTETYAIYLGLMKVGAVVMPGSEMLRSKDIEYRANHAGAKAVIAHVNILDQVELVREACPTLSTFVIVGGEQEGWTSFENVIVGQSTEFEAVQTASDEMAFLSYTSGTTGGPKGVVHTHGWPYVHQRIAATYWFDVQPGEMAWATAGPGWAKWVWSPFVAVLGKGGTAFVYAGRFSAEKYLELLGKHPITVLCATPTEYRMIAKVDGLERFKLAALRSACSAGEPLNREVIDTVEKYFGVTVRDGYGQTENSLLVGNFVGGAVRAGSMGLPAPGVRVAIIDEDGKEVPRGQVGDIAVDREAPVLFKGYLNDAERTARAHRGSWYITGDQGKMDEDGYIWFEGRADDIIISSGYTIGPFEVEDALVQHPDVAECAAVSSPDPDRGAIVKAFVVLKHPEQAGDQKVRDLQEHVKQLTAPYKYPREIEFVDALPKTTSGKIRRVELRAAEKAKKTEPANH